MIGLVLTRFTNHSAPFGDFPTVNEMTFLSSNISSYLVSLLIQVCSLGWFSHHPVSIVELCCTHPTFKNIIIHHLALQDKYFGAP